jgi:hypothetical protein
VSEHQVLLCPDCYPAARADLTHCSRCDGVRLVRRLDQVECLDCRLTRDAAPEAAAAEGGGVSAPAPRGADASLAAEVASALDRLLGNQ